MTIHFWPVKCVAFASLIFSFKYVSSAPNLTHYRNLPSGVTIRWGIDDPEWITFEMSGPTTGYLAIGFSPNGGMPGSDIYIGWVDSNGQGYIKDYFATENGQPVEDPKQDAELISASEVESRTTILFRRRWDTCDQRDFIIGENTMRLIWAWSEDDPYELHGLKMIPYHERDPFKRGSKSTFMKTLARQRKFPDEEERYPNDVNHVDFTVSNVRVPAAETYYHCRIVKFPRLTSKHHIIAYRPLIVSESLPHIHHISIFRCHIPEGLGLREESVFEKYIDMPGGNCYTSEAPIEWTRYCFELRVATGVGSEGDILPEHLGDVVGDSRSNTYYRLEVHYENPKGKYLMDSSGLRVFYTSKLRQFETAVLFTGHRRTPFLTIPPHQKEFNIYGFCSAECTRNGFGPQGVKIVSVLLHTHMAGRKIVLRHIRNGRELPPIAYDNHLDSNYQHYRMLKNEVRVLPGDELITECTFDTSANNTFVYGGLSIRREMCEAFIVYYPKSALIDCRSQPELYQYLGALGIMNVTGDMLTKLNLPFDPNHLPEKLRDVALPDDSLLLEAGRLSVVNEDVFKDLRITNPSKLRNRYVHDHMRGLHWNDDYFTKLVEKKWRNGPHYMHCSASGGKRILSNHIAAIPRYVENMEGLDASVCLQQMATSSAVSNSSFQFILISFSLSILYILTKL